MFARRRWAVRPPRARYALALVSAFGVVSLGTASFSLAVFADTSSSSASFGTDTLSPPSGLSATGGTSGSLSWTATPKTWATGYHVYRATALAGPYSQIATVTPRSSTTYADSPAAGTYWYIVRAYYQSWESVGAGPASATVSAGSVSTGYKLCASNAADTLFAGDSNGYESNAGRACTNPGTAATDASSGTGGTQACGTGAIPDVLKDRHQFWGFAFGLPGSVTSIDGIQVQADLGLNNNGGTTNACVQLSWDGGTTWTAMQSQAITAVGRNTYTFGTTSDTWGHAWTLAQLNSTNFEVRIVDASTSATKTFSLYALSAQVTYTP